MMKRKFVPSTPSRGNDAIVEDLREVNQLKESKALLASLTMNIEKLP
jgi:hypothetical protein